MKPHLLAILVPILFGSACVSNKSKVDVSIYHLKDVQLVERDNKAVRAEQQKRLRGAVEREDQLARRGQYFTVSWDVRDHVVEEPLKLVFHYHQASTGSKLLKLEKEFEASKKKGTYEFAVSGENYQNGGRVLDWRIEIYSGESLLVSEQSYLWE